ncbi:MAG TPA: hypothetical protein PKE47_08270, partial [Verrucomicrobiota bacterium]|nr:hypothetical protein [Verrucomicrobiota bacterium]
MSSVFIAPLLLLRSPESIATGVRWFLKDWLGLKGYEEWPRGRKALWLGAVAVVSGASVYGLAKGLSQRWLPGLEGWPLFGWAAVIGVLTVAVAVAVAVFTLVLLPACGAGLALRSLGIRVAATLPHLPAGIRCLPANWRENNFLTDSFVPAELLPGIRDHEPTFALDGLAKEWIGEEDWKFRIFLPFLGVFLFLPAFLYRLNIKATAWFWWPLAYLLRPAPAADAEGRQKQALCWPWTNPFQQALIVGTVLVSLASLTLHFLDPVSWEALRPLPALPPPLKVALAVDWARLAPWHWLQWTIALAGAGMLALAGHARSQDVNGNWRDYWGRCAWHLGLMTLLQRIRALATIFLLVLALGGLLLMDPAWQTWLRVPPGWITALEQFYQLP